MEVLKNVLWVILGITSILLTLLILLHRGQGGGLSDMFGGGINNTVNASGTATKTLNRITVIIALLWAASIIGLGLILRFTVGAAEQFPL